MPTMVRSTSTAMWPGYWRNCGRNSPNHGPIGQGQRLGGGQERGSDSQAHGVPAYRRRARRSHSEVLHGALESVSELSSAVRFCDREGKPERQAKKGISDRRLCYAVREAETDSAGRAVSEGGGHVGETGSPGRLGERHGICPEDHASQERAATKMPRPAGSVAATAVKGSRSPKRAEEMAGLWKAWKAKKRLPPLSTSPLEISQTARDFHIPSTPAIRFSHKNLTQKTKGSLTMGGGKVEIQRQDSHFPTAPSACCSKEENPSLKIGGVLSQKKYFVSQFRRSEERRVGKEC